MTRTAGDTRHRAAAAIALTDALEAAGFTAATIGEATSDEWATAAWCAMGRGIRVGPITPTIRHHVEHLLEKREQHPDPFEFRPVAHGPRRPA